MQLRLLFRALIPRMERHSSWRNFATLLDEAITRLAWIVCGGALTAEMVVRYVIPSPIGEKLFIRGEILKDSRRLVEAKVLITDGSGRIIAHSTGKAVKTS